MTRITLKQAAGERWPEDIFETLLRHRVRQVAYVPDAGHRRLIELCLDADELVAVPLTTEEEGVALLAGAWLGGERGVLLMQSSGVGNCVNLFSLTRVCRLPLLMLVTMRGEAGEFNPWQVPMGRNAASLLETCGIEPHPVHDRTDLAATVDRAAAAVFEQSSAAAVLISQQVLGVKSFATR